MQSKREVLLDSSNPVVRLCIEGIQAESRHDHIEALSLYGQAWEQCQDDVDACIAAHYLARQQETLADSLHWNQVALERASAANSDAVREFLPSLYLNLGWSHEVLEDLVSARSCYLEGARRLACLPPGPSTELVRDGIARGLERTSTPKQ